MRLKKLAGDIIKRKKNVGTEIPPVENHSSGYSDEVHAAGGSCRSAVLGISHFQSLLLSEKNNVRDFFLREMWRCGGSEEGGGAEEAGATWFSPKLFCLKGSCRNEGNRKAHTCNNLCVTSQRVQAFSTPMGSLLIESDTCLFLVVVQLRVTGRNSMQG